MAQAIDLRTIFATGSLSRRALVASPAIRTEPNPQPCDPCPLNKWDRSTPAKMLASGTAYRASCSKKGHHSEAHGPLFF